MKIFLMIVSLILITIVLLQSKKADGASSIISGGNTNLFANRKERGPELFITRLTYLLGFTFFIVSLVMDFM